MKQLFLQLGVDRALKLFAYGLTLLLALLLLVGGIWAMRLPSAPRVLPDPQALAPVPVILPEARFITERSVNGVASVAAINQVEAGDIGDSDNFGQGRGADIISRPLFWVGRRPAADDQEPVAVAYERPRKDEFDQVKLVGIYFAGASSGVIYELKGERLRLRITDELLGWTLSTLNADSAVFTQGENEQKVLQLEHANTGKYTATAKSAPSNVAPADANDSAR